MDTLSTPLAKLDLRILETAEISRATLITARRLAELKGMASAIPDREIIGLALIVQEARDSAVLDHIVASYDEIFQSAVVSAGERHPGASKVLGCVRALDVGYDSVRRMQTLTIRNVLEIQHEVEVGIATLRPTAGAAPIGSNERPARRSRREPEQLTAQLRDIEKFISDGRWWFPDPLVRMAVVHRQFLNIQAFPGGNGRTGRILNTLLLVLNGLLELPVLCLSRQMVRTREEYTRVPDAQFSEDHWRDWVVYVLRLVHLAAGETMRTMEAIRGVMADYRERIPKGHRFCSPKLVDALFQYPCMKIEILMRKLGVSRLTATKYLEALAANGFLRKERVGRSSCYMNVGLVQVLMLADERKPEVVTRDDDD